MSARIIDGKAIAADLRARVGEAVKTLPGQPALAVVIVGDDPASQVYVRSKVKETAAAGMRSLHVELPVDTPEADVVARVKALSDDPAIDGILVQLPLPAHIDAQRVLDAIDPDKDVDGLTDAGAGRLALGRPGLRPCTPYGCVILAKSTGEKLAGKNVVVLGRSILVGRPAAMLFLLEDCTVTIAHSKTRDLAGLCRTADILVPAIGRPHFVQGDWVREGAMVLDVGINRVPAPEKGEGKTRLVGDVDYEPAAERAGWITPVPGGVGPMTIACLLRNTVLAACVRRGWKTPAL
ncbi:MAG: methylenetetrahydrofolate dehydrogenase (NADP+) / methenyltetrahydrofolate cyclohydrolase [Alphaproteobacteria bacterium]|nr:MAG: methylenetetrahydrofolate dehydrogenase (NADP+) / methenyltetrahydrofolate cyclohydrolase [Caulobacteraceae bacterium]TPW08369.1 MAG: methylenetetrahydrofolate dehydrogenase (NADP+) / methenyltetrahydrofolate cyclohydrolase [Alphaproteobacteria bacterium]